MTEFTENPPEVCFAYKNFTANIDKLESFKELCPTTGEITTRTNIGKGKEGKPSDFVSETLRGGIISIMATFEAFVGDLLEEATILIHWQRKPAAADDALSVHEMTNMKYSKWYSNNKKKAGKVKLYHEQKQNRGEMGVQFHKWNNKYSEILLPQEHAEFASDGMFIDFMLKQGPFKYSYILENEIAAEFKISRTIRLKTPSERRQELRKEQAMGNAGPNSIYVTEQDDSALCIILRLFYGMRCVMAHGRHHKTFEEDVLKNFPSCEGCKGNQTIDCAEAVLDLVCLYHGYLDELKKKMEDKAEKLKNEITKWKDARGVENFIIHRAERRLKEAEEAGKRIPVQSKSNSFTSPNELKKKVDKPVAKVLKGFEENSQMIIAQVDNELEEAIRMLKEAEKDEIPEDEPNKEDEEKSLKVFEEKSQMIIAQVDKARDELGEAILMLKEAEKAEKQISVQIESNIHTIQDELKKKVENLEDLEKNPRVIIAHVDKAGYALDEAFDMLEEAEKAGKRIPNFNIFTSQNEQSKANSDDAEYILKRYFYKELEEPVLPNSAPFAFYHMFRVYYWLKENKRGMYITYHQLLRVKKFIKMLAHRMYLAVAGILIKHYGFDKKGVWLVKDKQGDLHAMINREIHEMEI